jgi:hypothetical protein
MSKLGTVKAIVDGKEVVIENVVSIEQEMDDVETSYSMCGSPYGKGPIMCPKCQEKNKVRKPGSPEIYCGERFIAHQITTWTTTVNVSMVVDKIIEVRGGFAGIEWNQQ